MWMTDWIKGLVILCFSWKNNNLLNVLLSPLFIYYRDFGLAWSACPFDWSHLSFSLYYHTNFNASLNRTTVWVYLGSTWCGKRGCFGGCFYIDASTPRKWSCVHASSFNDVFGQFLFKNVLYWVPCLMASKLSAQLLSQSWQDQGKGDGSVFQSVIIELLNHSCLVKAGDQNGRLAWKRQIHTWTLRLWGAGIA